MLAEHFFNLQRGDLEPARLDDVDAGAAKQPVRAAVDDGHVARPEPALAECRARFVGPLPVLEEHGRPAHFQLAGGSLRHLSPILVDEPYFDAWQRHANETGPAFAVKRI